ncbi:MAG: hypothetical protein M3Q76_06275, partial [Acidobacteriota bacterium]|nr:hypothetical protein [Acidobacteriota bacterium]
MSQQANEPVINRPPTNMDVAPPDVAAAETVGQTRIGGFRIPTETLRAYTMLFVLVVIWLYFHFSTEQIFLDPRNFSNLMRQTAVTGILAVGMLMVIVAGQIDLSIGSVVGLIGGMAALAQGQGLAASLGVAILLGVLIGAVHGALVAYANIPAFIVTLGGLLAWRGVVLWLSKGETIPVRLEPFKKLGQDYLAPTAGWALAALAIAAVVWLTLSRNRARRRYELDAPN